MKKKKSNPNIFLIGFNSEDFKHQRAAQILTKFAQRRRASSFIADAIDFYERFGGFEKVLESILMHGGGFEKALESILMQGVRTPDREVPVTGPESVHSQDSEPKNELEPENKSEPEKSVSHSAAQTPIGEQYKTFQPEKQELLIQELTRFKEEVERLRKWEKEIERSQEEVGLVRQGEMPKDPRESLKPTRTQEDTEEQNKYNSVLREAIKVVKNGF